MPATTRFAKPIVTDSIESGLDRKQLKYLSERIADINSERLRNTRDALSSRHKSFLDVLPLLFHINHPLLPGYINHQTPAGIIHYTPSDQAIRLAKMFGRSFSYNPPTIDPSNEPAINGIFIMGSVGTIAYSHHSDLDVWVCYSDRLSEKEIKALDLKCSYIEKHADKIDLEVHLFTMNATAFASGKNKSLSEESSGNAQHYLLLDEFYRSAISLAGQIPAWWFVPESRHPDYKKYLDILFTKRYMPADKTLDFGQIKNIPEQEFLSAGIWQLYKAIDSPYKSLIKLVLLEAYANDQGQQKTISDSVKKIVYSGDFECSDLDPYIMSYAYIENYLTEKNQFDRLQVIRRCLYFKINKPLSIPFTQKKPSWQRQKLTALVKQWEWTDEEIKQLDNRSAWKAAAVITEKQILVDELQRSFTFLKSLGHQNKKGEKKSTENKLQKSANEHNQSREELTILQRKLQAFYKASKGKIDNINPGISSDLSESFLTFVEDKQTSTWSIYTVRLIEIDDLKNHGALKQSSNIIELILWCYFNQLITKNTSIECVFILNGDLYYDHPSMRHSLSSHTIRQLITDLQYWQPLPFTDVDHNDYQQAAYVTQVMILINPDRQPISEMLEKGFHHITGQENLFDRSDFNQQLLQSITLVTIDNWHIVRTTHLSENCLTACLFHYLTLLTQLAYAPKLSVICHTPTFGHAIQQRLTQLLTEMENNFQSHVHSSAFQFPRYIFSAEGRYYVCEVQPAPQLTDRPSAKPSITAIKNEQQLLRYFAKKPVSHRSFIADSLLRCSHPLHCLSELSNDNAIQLLYSINRKKARVYLLDECGSLFVCQLSAFNEQVFLRPLHHFIRSSIQHLQLINPVSKENFDVHPVKFYRYQTTRNGQISLQQNLAVSDVSDLPFYNVSVELSERALPNNQQYHELIITILCGDKRFSSDEYGKDVFNKAAHYIVSQRKSGEQYPCYITDIDLSSCPSILNCPSVYGLELFYSRPFLASDAMTEKPTKKAESRSKSKKSRSHLQLIHFFAAKVFVEQKLNAALFSLPKNPFLHGNLALDDTSIFSDHSAYSSLTSSPSGFDNNPSGANP